MFGSWRWRKRRSAGQRKTIASPHAYLDLAGRRRADDANLEDGTTIVGGGASAGGGRRSEVSWGGLRSGNDSADERGSDKSELHLGVGVRCHSGLSWSEGAQRVGRVKLKRVTESDCMGCDDEKTVKSWMCAIESERGRGRVLCLRCDAVFEGQAEKAIVELGRRVKICVSWDERPSWPKRYLNLVAGVQWMAKSEAKPTRPRPGRRRSRVFHPPLPPSA